MRPRLVHRLLNRLGRQGGLRLFRLFSRTLDPASVVRGPGGFDLRVIAEPELLSLCGDAELDLASEKVGAAIARGDVCLGAFGAEGLAGYCWLAFSPLPHLDGVWVDFHADVVWTYKSLVRPAFRGRGIAPALYCFADELCIKRNRRRSVLCMEAHNRPSAEAARRAAYAPAGFAAYWRTSDRLLTWSSGGAKSLSVRFHLRLAACCAGNSE